MCFLFIGWQWTQQWATLLHRALLAWHTWPLDPWPLQWSPDHWAEVRSWVHALPLPCGAGHRSSSGPFSEALGFGHCPTVCNRRKWQRSGLQLSVCSQCHGGSACGVSGMSNCGLFLVPSCTFKSWLWQFSVFRLQRKNIQEACLKINKLLS